MFKNSYAKRKYIKAHGLTAAVIHEMLTENTGIHMLDSGGPSGRAWQRNQGVDFASRPASTLTFTVPKDPQEAEDTLVEIEVIQSLYHLLNERLDYDRFWTARFRAFCNAQDSGPDMGLIEEFLKSLRAKGYRARGIYGEGGPTTDYTYNWETLLDQDYHFTYTELQNIHDKESVPLVFLSIHGGADARGGFTDVKVFRPSGDDEMGIFDCNKATIFCDGPVPDIAPMLPGMEAHAQDLTSHYWDTDDTTHWYPSCDSNSEQLQTYTAAELRIDDEGNGFCPICGGRLRVY